MTSNEEYLDSLLSETLNAETGADSAMERLAAARFTSAKSDELMPASEEIPAVEESAEENPMAEEP
ncbi:MAG: hypothetical protein ACI4F8_00550, partial [Lachnospiraceae bacterium]